MIVCFLGVYINISRLLTFACFLIVFGIVQSKLLLAVDAASGFKEITNSSLNNTLTLDQADSLFNITETCIAEVINETLPYYSLPYRIFAGALVVPITICAISGNILVIHVIKHYRALRMTGNVFLASLAVADVGVSTLAMTFYGLQLIQGRWILGAFMCRLWFSCDVLFSTASIMHLACIALDRYLSIVRPFKHENSSSDRRRYGMIAGCWIGSALLSFIPIFTGIYTTDEQRQKISCLNRVRGRCIFAVNQAYAIVSSSFSFWVPGAVMIIMYVMLIRIADKKEREAYRLMDSFAPRRRFSPHNQYNVHQRSSDDQALVETTPTTNQSHRTNKLATTASASASASASATTTGNGSYNTHRRSEKHDSFDTNMERQPSVDLPGNYLDPRNSKLKHLRRERRAVKTLGAIMVAFLICWLPFFVRYSACEPDRCRWKFMPIIEDIVFWVGYFNSMINPFLYAFHNRDFRTAFRKTLCKYFVCCRQRRASKSSNIPLPPATPSVEMQRTGSIRQKTKSRKNPINSTTNIHEQKLITTNKIIQENHELETPNGLEAPNGYLTGGQNSIPSNHSSVL
ncbi:unnamed protein product [Rotaria magnacalcarata]|uniref:G-protein coupled receptors family 1 profile domain-containing protein n=2 Tax=Rotaria magnacalcarata TaxID=392030 RepID=A0A815XV21_9BILA|nr:unnamed protein product [Rotaria magnacalcarata]CAF1627340.1 unnamed protein product [Rotaria magnacalcarata]CAF4040800.1 unnamed protein product [Rotaria magnacalcarata]CAF4103256.1 unnamed protein product [Rotaria magnacalcarata]